MDLPNMKYPCPKAAREASTSCIMYMAAGMSGIINHPLGDCPYPYPVAAPTWRLMPCTEI